jgi:hypothetical protein
MANKVPQYKTGPARPSPMFTSISERVPAASTATVCEVPWRQRRVPLENKLGPDLKPQRFPRPASVARREDRRKAKPLRGGPRAGLAPISPPRKPKSMVGTKR